MIILVNFFSLFYYHFVVSICQHPIIKESSMFLLSHWDLLKWRPFYSILCTIEKLLFWILWCKSYWISNHEICDSMSSTKKGYTKILVVEIFIFHWQLCLLFWNFVYIIDVWSCSYGLVNVGGGELLGNLKNI